MRLITRAGRVIVDLVYVFSNLQSGQVAGSRVTIKLNKCLGGGKAGLAAAEARDDFMVLAPDVFPVLAYVSEQGLSLLLQHRTDVNIDVWHKSLRLTAQIDLKEIQLRPRAQGEPCTV